MIKLYSNQNYKFIISQKLKRINSIIYICMYILI